MLGKEEKRKTYSILSSQLEKANLIQQGNYFISDSQSDVRNIGKEEKKIF